MNVYKLEYGYANAVGYKKALAGDDIIRVVAEDYGTFVVAENFNAALDKAVALLATLDNSIKVVGVVDCGKAI